VLQQVFHMYVSGVSSAFRRTLQVLYADISKVDQVLYLLRRFSAASHRCLFLLRHLLGIRRLLHLFLTAGDAWADTGPRRRAKRCGNKSERTGASPSDQTVANAEGR
jgi:hypothetical protein